MRNSGLTIEEWYERDRQALLARQPAPVPVSSGFTPSLLAQAIADAKAVRATALANAKAALEEAFANACDEAGVE
jgi:hypothetical protein